MLFYIYFDILAKYIRENRFGRLSNAEFEKLEKVLQLIRRK